MAYNYFGKGKVKSWQQPNQKQKSARAERRAQQRQEERQRQRTYRQKVKSVALGRVVEQKVRNLIEQYRGSGYEASANRIEGMLDSEIAMYGDKALQSMGNAESEVLELVEVALHYRVGSAQHESAIMELMILISGGEVPDAQTQQDMDSVMEEDDFEPLDADMYPEDYDEAPLWDFEDEDDFLPLE